MSLSSRIKLAVRRNAHESRQARERREAQAWRQSWLAYSCRWRRVRREYLDARLTDYRDAYVLAFNSPGGPLRDFPGVTVHFSVDTGGRHFGPPAHDTQTLLLGQKSP